MIIRKASGLVHFDNGTEMTEMLGSRAELGGYGKFSFTKISASPNHTDREHYHSNSDELYYVIKGSCTVTVEGTPHLLNEGDCLLIEHGERHFLKTDEKGCSLIIICSPAWDEKDSYYI